MTAQEEDRAKGSSAEHTKLVKEACEWLANNRYFAWPNRTGGAKIDGRYIPFGKVGSADIISILEPHGRHAEFEAKTGGSKQRKGQKTHQKMVQSKGGLYLIFHSVQELSQLLRSHGY